MKKKIQFELFIGILIYCLMIKYSDSNVGSEKHWSRVGFGLLFLFKPKAKGYQSSIEQEEAQGGEQLVLPVFANLNQDCGVNNIL